MDRRIIRKFREAKLQSKKQKPDEREGHNLFDYFSRDAQLSAATETTSLNERVTAGLLVTRNKEKRANTDRHGTHTHTHATALRDSYRSYSIVEENNLFSFFFFFCFEIDKSIDYLRETGMKIKCFLSGYPRMKADVTSSSADSDKSRWCFVRN